MSRRTKTAGRKAEAKRPARRDHSRTPDKSVALVGLNGYSSSRANGVGLFSHIAARTAYHMGRPLTFLTAATLVVIWAATGPIFGFSDTWQLIINTSTTIVTFLMVFLIQHTQNRDTLALQIKLAELIIEMRGAKNELATVEDLSEEELEQLHEEFRTRSERALESLRHRRSAARH
jgi:low affinity Fe/Cu permease